MRSIFSPAAAGKRHAPEWKLFIELEPGAPESFHTGWWLSLYDADRAQELEGPAKRTFIRIHESMPAN